MGYIAPVTPYDYIQYANRTVAATKKKREIQAVSLVKSVPFHLNEANEWESYVNAQWPQWSERNRHPKKVNQVYKKQGESAATKEAKAKITGKGLNINEVI